MTTPLGLVVWLVGGVIDGATTLGLEMLRRVPARDILRMRVLSAVQATLLYGTQAGGGAILIETRRGRQR